MSHYIVMPLRPEGAHQGDDSVVLTDKVARECLKKYWLNETRANEYASGLAKKYPTVQFAVFGPKVIFETAEPKLLQKRINEVGEIILDRSGE